MSFVEFRQVVEGANDSETARIISSLLAGESLSGDIYFAIGLNESLRAIQEGYALKVVVAADADESVLSKLGTPRNLVRVPSKGELGECLGIAVSCAVACLLTKNHYLSLTAKRKKRGKKQL